MRPISWDLGLKLDLAPNRKLSINPPEGSTETLERFSTYNLASLSGAYYGKYNLVYETTLGVGMESNFIDISKNSFRGTRIRAIQSITGVFGETVKYRFALPVGRFTFAALPFFGLQYSYSTLKDGTYSRENITSTPDYQKGEVPRTTSTVVLNTNHLLSLNTGLGVEISYNNVIGIFGEFFYRYGFYNHYRHDITYQFIYEPERKFSLNQRINSFGFSFGLKFYFRKKAE